jgi:tetratricopeptide (TPR) repeat protein
MRPLAARNPDVPQYQFTMAGLHLNLGQLQRGQPPADAAARSLTTAHDLLGPLVEQYPSQEVYGRDLAITLRLLGIEMAITGRWDEADARLQHSLGLLAQLAEAHPEKPDFQRQREQTEKAIEQLKKVRAAKTKDRAAK